MRIPALRSMFGAAGGARRLGGRFTLLALLALTPALVPALTGPVVHADGYAFGYRATRFAEFEYMFIEQGGRSTISCTSHDWDAVRRLAKRMRRDLFAFAFERDDRTYVVSDPAWLARGRKIIEPMQVVGRKQSELGEQQSRLGEQQSALGEKQGALGGRMAEIGEKIGEIAVRAASDDEDDAADRARMELEREMDRLSERQRALTREQRPLAQAQQELGRRQQALGREQNRLSAEAAEALERLAREAIDAGVAQPVD